ncbi:MAG: hypothetical protein ACXWL5_01900 [Candidatus Chromulinivorax sp.]
MKIKQIIFVCCIIASKIILSVEVTQDHSITIFVHGTYLMRKLLHYLPSRPFMYCPEGLTLAKTLPNYYHFYKIADGCMACDRDHYTMDQFYVFGWDSEHVHDNVRKKAAEKLVQEMYDVIIDYYLTHGVIPKIRLLGYSHGGNVILNMAHYIPLYADLDDVEFEVWLFGTPVQVINHDLVNSTCFTSIYSLYSKRDKVQILDPQGLRNWKIAKNNFWSKRTFSSDARCIQVDFTVNGQSIKHGHYNYLFPVFPKIKKLIEQQVEDLDIGMISVDFKI